MFNGRFFKRKPSRYTELYDFDDLERVLEASEREPVLVFKHSSMCSLSSWARRQVERIADDPGCPLFELVVQRARPVSAAITSATGVSHQTPQAIIIHNRNTIYHSSHSQIRWESLRDAILSESGKSTIDNES